jgi:hypothetical protein
MKVYIASSVKNHSKVVWWTHLLRTNGHLVFSFIEQGPNTVNYGLDFPDLKCLNVTDFLKHPTVSDAFNRDKFGLQWAETILLLLPAGRSAHLEAGYALGLGKRLYVFQSKWPAGDLELMYNLADGLYSRPEEVLNALRAAEECEIPSLTR